MKVIINQPNAPKRELTNLPAADASRELLRQRLERKRQLREQAELGNRETEETVSFASPVPEQPLTENAAEIEQDNHDDLFTRLLTDEDPETEIISEETSWKNSRWVPALLCAALLLLSGVWYFAKHFERELPLDRVTVEGTHLLKDQEIIALAAIDRNEKFYDIDLKQIEARLLRHSFIKSAHPRREVNPETIVLHIEERQPVAMMKAQNSDEAVIIDRDGMKLHPKLVAGLRDPAKLFQVPLLTGVSDRDTAGYQTMAALVTAIESLDSGVLQSAIGELHRTPTGAYVLYTVETQTPIFIGNPTDAPFQTALEAEKNPIVSAGGETHFTKQLHLLAKAWRSKLAAELQLGNTLYVDARFHGQIILKAKSNSVKSNTAKTKRMDAGAAKPMATSTEFRQTTRLPQQSVTNDLSVLTLRYPHVADGQTTKDKLQSHIN